MNQRYALPIVAALLAGAVCISLLTGASEASKEQVELPATDRSRLLGSFSILREVPTPPIPNAIKAMEEVVEERDFELNFASAHRRTTNGLKDVWVIPGNSYICVMGSNPIVAGCNTTDQAIRKGVSVVAIKADPKSPSGKRYTLLGIAPDGMTGITVRENDRPRVKITVMDNVYSYTSPNMIQVEPVQ